MSERRLTVEEVALKLGTHGHPGRIRDLCYSAELLTSLGVRPGDFDHDMWPFITLRGVEIARQRVIQERERKHFAVAVAVIAGVSLFAAPALASEIEFERDVAPWGFVALLVFALGMFFWRPGFEEHEHDPHSEPYGDHPRMETDR